MKNNKSIKIKRKGGAQIFLGAATIVVLLVVAYVLIVIIDESLGNQITAALTQLRVAVTGK